MKNKFFAVLAVVAAVASVLGLRGPVASAQDPGEACSGLDFEQPQATAAAFDVIVAGRVEEASAGTVIRPEYFLKGAAVRGPLALQRDGECPAAELIPGSRVLVGLMRVPGGFRWPSPDAVRVLPDDQAAEDALIAPLREVTGQQAYPPAVEGQGFDWGGVGIPVIAALAALMAVGLYLMRLWHRIDPT